MIFVQAEVDEEIKSEAERLLEGQGFIPGEAIRLFYQEVVAHHGLPFALDTGVSRGRSEEDSGEEKVMEPGFPEISASEIAEVIAEFSDARVRGDRMFKLLQDYRQKRDARKGLRQAVAC